MVVTPHISLTWPRNLKEPGVATWWIIRLQPFTYDILHRPGKHQSHANGLSCQISGPCKSDTCSECDPLLHLAILEEDMVCVCVGG